MCTFVRACVPHCVCVPFAAIDWYLIQDWDISWYLFFFLYSIVFPRGGGYSGIFIHTLAWVIFWVKNFEY